MHVTAAPQLEGPDRPPGGSRADVRAASTSGATTTARTGSARTCTRPRAGKPAARQARGHRPYGEGPRDHRAQGDAGARTTMPDGTGRRRSYSATQHAREWIAPEVDRRLLQWFIDEWRANNKPIKNMLKHARALVRARLQPGRLPVHLPEPRHAPLAEEPPRAERRLPAPRSATASTRTATIDEHWNYDGEGSSSAILERHLSRARRKAPSPRRRRSRASSTASTSASRSTTTPSGSGSSTRRAGRSGRRPATTRSSTPSSGNKDNPAIPGFTPGLSSDVLYVTNGEMTDFAYSRRGTISWTPELARGCTSCGFVFPDDEALVQAEFQETCRSPSTWRSRRPIPANPISHLGITTKPFYLKSDDTYKFGLPEANFRLRLFLRRSAAGPGARTSEPGRRHRRSGR